MDNYKLWKQPNYDYDDENSCTLKSFEWLYHHILEPELYSIRCHDSNPDTYLEINPPAHVNNLLTTLRGHIFLYFPDKAIDIFDLIRNLLEI